MPEVVLAGLQRLCTEILFGSLDFLEAQGFSNLVAFVGSHVVVERDVEVVTVGSDD
jgi:hypothetical protein